VTLDLGFGNIKAYAPQSSAGIIVLRPVRQDKSVSLKPTHEPRELTAMRVSWITAFLIVGCVSTSGVTHGSERRKDVSGIAIVGRLPLAVAWTAAARVDVDCDGRRDEVFVGRDAARYYVAVVRAPVTARSEATYVAFRLSGDSEDSFCGTPEPLEEESLDIDVVEILGDVPEGWKRSARCKGLRLTAGECDRFHLYWNRVAKRLSWWRL
jgi:hypothetical protein